MTDLRALPDLTADDLRMLPLAQAETIPARWYTDARFLTAEREVVFARAWHYAGHAGRLPHPGDYLTAEIATGESVLLVRGPDDVVRAFFNVCRHRGGPLAMDACGHARMLQCRYHGWTYTLDGALRGVPRFDRTELFDKRDFGLVPVPLATWQGLLFVNPTGEGPALDRVLDGIAERIAPLRLDDLRFHARHVYDVACNWKAYVDNYLEGYHLPLVHPELCTVLDARAYVTETSDYHSLQHSPLRDGNGVYAGSDGAAFYYFVYPNTMLNVLPGRLQVNTVLPDGPDRCRVVFDYHYANVDGPEAQARIADDVAFSDRVQAEDAEICAHVQRGLHSRAYDRGRFSAECEAGVHHFQRLLKQDFARALAARP